MTASVGGSIARLRVALVFTPVSGCVIASDGTRCPLRQSSYFTQKALRRKDKCTLAYDVLNYRLPVLPDWFLTWTNRIGRMKTDPVYPCKNFAKTEQSDSRK